MDLNGISYLKIYLGNLRLLKKNKKNLELFVEYSCPSPNLNDNTCIPSITYCLNILFSYRTMLPVNPRVISHWMVKHELSRLKALIHLRYVYFFYNAVRFKYKTPLGKSEDKFSGFDIRLDKNKLHVGSDLSLTTLFKCFLLFFNCLEYIVSSSLLFQICPLFQITTAKRTYYLTADNKDDMDHWIKGNFEKQSTHILYIKKNVMEPILVDTFSP